MVSNRDALGVWMAELDSNSFLDGLWLPLEFSKQLVSLILASIAVIHLALGLRQHSTRLCPALYVAGFVQPRRVVAWAIAGEQKDRRPGHILCQDPERLFRYFVDPVEI